MWSGDQYLRFLSLSTIELKSEEAIGFENMSELQSQEGQTAKKSRVQIDWNDSVSWKLNLNHPFVSKGVYSRSHPARYLETMA